MSKGMWMAVAALALVPTAARAQDVAVDYDKAFDFSKVKTFAVQLANPPQNPLQAKRVVGEVEEALAAKGWTKAADASKADALVMLHGATETKRNLNTFYSGMGGWRYSGMGSAQTTVQEYTVGTLVVDIFDAKSKSLLFRGTASDELSDKPAKNEKKLDKATTKMFKDFPPGAKKEK